MKIIIKRKIGDSVYEFEIEEKNEIEALAKAGSLTSMPAKCKLCGSIDVHLASNRAKGFLFVKVICHLCNARSQLGQYKEGGFFWKEWELYNPPNQVKDSSETRCQE